MFVNCCCVMRDHNNLLSCIFFCLIRGTLVSVLTDICTVILFFIYFLFFKEIIHVIILVAFSLMLDAGKVSLEWHIGKIGFIISQQTVEIRKQNFGKYFLDKVQGIKYYTLMTLFQVNLYNLTKCYGRYMDFSGHALFFGRVIERQNQIVT